MELFTIERYDENGAQEPVSNENEILKKLLKKAEKRKRDKHIETSEQTINSEVTNELQEHGKKSKVKTPKKEELESEENIEPVLPSTEDVDLIHAADDFKVLGEDVDYGKREKVEMVLPAWLAHPTIISTSITTETDASEDKTTPDEISKLPFLTTTTRQALKELSVTRLFPVQSAVIPWLLEAHNKPAPFRPRDICVSAPTGSGKTLAFAIPVVQLLTDRLERKIRALVVLPVAELACQVYKVFKKLCEKTDLTVCLLSKQLPFPVEQAKLVECYKGQYYSKVDIVVTTPGRLVDHMHATKGFCLKSLKFLVIDEADRIMDAVFQNWLYHLDTHVRDTSDQLLSGRAAPLCYNELLQTADTQPHKLLFSATLSQDPEKLQNLRLFQPKLFTSVLTNLNELREKYANEAEQQTKAQTGRGEFIGKYTTPAELTEKYCITESRLKPLTLYSLINEHQWQRFLCFTNSIESAGRLAFVLTEMSNKSDISICELSASKSAKERANILSMFARGKIHGLVCSDALARGIDIPDVDIVISYDPPRHIKTYIHRIGRTARAGRQGTAITLLTQKELGTFNQMLAEVDKSLTQEISVLTNTEEEYANIYSAALRALRQNVEQEKRKKLLLKERAKSHTLLHKDPNTMTFMEKLQAQANAVVMDKVQLNSTNKPTEKLISRKEFKQKNSSKRSKFKNKTKNLGTKS